MKEVLLKQQAISAVGWSSVEALSRQGLQFVFSVVLARLLSPEEFGTVAMILLFTSVAGIFADGGFSAALIQKQQISIEDTSSVFFFNLAMGLATALLMVVAAPWIAAFYRTPVLQPLTRFLALSLFLGAFGAVHSALLSRDLDFRTLTRISVVATLSSGVVAIILAWRGWGVWSLAVQGLVSTVLSVLLLWLWRPWRPALRFSSTALRSLFRFGSYLFVSGLLDTAFNRMYTVIIGKVYSAKDLGYYTRADTTRQTPVMLMSTVIDRVMFPLLSSAACDRQLMHRGIRKALKILMLVNVPLCLGLTVVARPLVFTLFGEKWNACVPYLQVLSIGGVLWPLHIINLSALKALGRSDLFFKVEAFKKILGVSAIIVTSAISVLAMAWSVVALGIASFFVNAHFVGLLLGYSAGSQLRDALPCLVAGASMMFCLWTVGKCLSPMASAWLLCAQVSVGFVVYSLSCSILKIDVFRELLWEIKGRAIRLRRAVF